MKLSRAEGKSFLQVHWERKVAGVCMPILNVYIYTLNAYIFECIHIYETAIKQNRAVCNSEIL